MLSHSTQSENSRQEGLLETCLATSNPCQSFGLGKAAILGRKVCTSFRVRPPARWLFGSFWLPEHTCLEEILNRTKPGQLRNQAGSRHITIIYCMYPAISAIRCKPSPEKLGPVACNSKQSRQQQQQRGPTNALEAHQSRKRGFA